MRVIVTGAASGIGAATARLFAERGAEVATVDVAAGAVHRCDVADPSAVDALVDRLPGEFDALVNCAGLPGGGDPLRVFSVNFLGLRYLTESLLDRVRSVVHVASVAGNGWPANTEALEELMAAESFHAGSMWAEAHRDLLGSGYAFSKEAVQHFTLWRAPQTIRHGVRMNSVCPGVTDTPMLPAFRTADTHGRIDKMIDLGTGRAATPEQIAPALAFLAGADASYVNGVNLHVDAGFTAAAITRQVD